MSVIFWENNLKQEYSTQKNTFHSCPSEMLGMNNTEIDEAIEDMKKEGLGDFGCGREYDELEILYHYGDWENSGEIITYSEDPMFSEKL